MLGAQMMWAPPEGRRCATALSTRVAHPDVEANTISLSVRHASPFRIDALDRPHREHGAGEQKLRVPPLDELSDMVTIISDLLNNKRSRVLIKENYTMSYSTGVACWRGNENSKHEHAEDINILKNTAP